eukprot:365602-Chlamydomonas_euryale.AAC.4
MVVPNNHVVFYRHGMKPSASARPILQPQSTSQLCPNRSSPPAFFYRLHPQITFRVCPPPPPLDHNHYLFPAVGECRQDSPHSLLPLAPAQQDSPVPPMRNSG